jgi:UDP-N-acetyl-D-mannosaminuronate dehydrogenase
MKAKNFDVAVVGLGCVGLPLALQFVEAGLRQKWKPVPVAKVIVATLGIK